MWQMFRKWPGWKDIGSRSCQHPFLLKQAAPGWVCASIIVLITYYTYMTFYIYIESVYMPFIICQRFLCYPGCIFCTVFPYLAQNALHAHVSLWSAHDDKNLFPDANGDMGLSDTARHFMAGVLKHSREMCGVLCPTINSYKR